MFRHWVLICGVRVRVRFRVMFRRGDGWLGLGLCLGEGFKRLCLGIGSLFVMVR